MNKKGKGAFIAALILGCGALALLYFRMPRLAGFLLLGLLQGTALECSDFCLVTGVTELLYTGRSPALAGAAAGLVLAVPAFALMFAGKMPDPSTGVLPLNAHVVPLGWNVPLGGLLFGFGMMPAGCCALGSLRRTGEGSLRALTALIGTVLGLFAYRLCEKRMQNLFMGDAAALWLPAKLGYVGAAAACVAGLLLILFLLRRGEKRTPGTKKLPDRRFFGGVALAVFAVAAYGLLDHSLGVTGELGRLAEILTGAFGLDPTEAEAVQGACVIRASAGDLTWGLMLNAGIVWGALTAALYGGSFRVKGFASVKWAALCLLGAAVMGFGIGLAGGCGLGALYASVACLGLDGWVFGAGALLGAAGGLKLMEKSA